jgi:hypothetical protein
VLLSGSRAGDDLKGRQRFEPRLDRILDDGGEILERESSARASCLGYVCAMPCFAPFLNERPAPPFSDGKRLEIYSPLCAERPRRQQHFEHRPKVKRSRIPRLRVGSVYRWLTRILETHPQRGRRFGRNRQVAGLRRLSDSRESPGTLTIGCPPQGCYPQAQ